MHTQVITELTQECIRLKSLGYKDDYIYAWLDAIAENMVSDTIISNIVKTTTITDSTISFPTKY